jgi:hypothetical protein
VSREPVGTVAVVDLESACELFGRDTLPYPLGRSRPVGSVWLATRDVRPIDERLDDGDLRGVRAWVEAFVRSDVSVECRVKYPDEDAPDLRLHAVRSGEQAFVAVQGRDRDGVDVIDIYAISPARLGVAVAETVGLHRPGAHPRIAVTAGGDAHRDHDGDDGDEYGTLDFLVSHAAPAVTGVDRGDVMATGTVQTRYEPARQWGTDPERRILEWIHVRDDGDYLFEPDDAVHAEPLDTETLTAYLDGFIADDLAVLRDRAVGVNRW